MKLTLKQLQVYDYLLTCLDQGFIPQYKEIREKFGWKSDNSVLKNLRVLKKKGYLVDKPGRIQLIKK